MDDTHLLLNILASMSKENTSVVFTEKYTDHYTVEIDFENLELNIQENKTGKR
jgi:hypothetical protein